MEEPCEGLSHKTPQGAGGGGALPLPAAPPSLPVPLPTGRSQQPSGFGEKCGAGEASEPGAKPLPGWDRALLPSHPSDLTPLRSRPAPGLKNLVEKWFLSPIKSPGRERYPEIPPWQGPAEGTHRG